MTTADDIVERFYAAVRAVRSRTMDVSGRDAPKAWVMLTEAIEATAERLRAEHRYTELEECLESQAATPTAQPRLGVYAGTCKRGDSARCTAPCSDVDGCAYCDECGLWEGARSNAFRAAPTEEASLPSREAVARVMYERTRTGRENTAYTWEELSEPNRQYWLTLEADILALLPAQEASLPSREKLDEALKIVCDTLEEFSGAGPGILLPPGREAQCRRAINALQVPWTAALLPVQGEAWRPIEELHAEVGDRIWGAHAVPPGYVGGWQCALRLSDRFGGSSLKWVDEDGAVRSPTHWRPLPAGPLPPPPNPEVAG